MNDTPTNAPFVATNQETDMYRQGDVLIIPIAELPPGLKPVAKEQGRVVLAHGEVTGHAHTIRDRNVNGFRDPKLNRLFLNIVGDHTGPLAGELIEEGDDWFLAQTSLREKPVKFAKHHASINDGEIKCGPFALVDHDEHHPYAVPDGNGLVMRQREYTPEAIRNVAD